MRLRIQFSGTQLFVPIPDASTRSRVHVVMPKSAGHHAPENHIPMLAVNASYLVEGSHAEGKGWYTYPLRGLVLTIDEPDTLDMRICPEILNLRELTDRRIDTDALGRNTHENAVSRVDLYAGGFSGIERGACWYWTSATPRPAAHIAEWEVQWHTDTVSLVLQEFGGANSVTLPTLHPLANSDVVKVRILHLPAADLVLEEEEVVHEPLPQSEAPHFGSYFFLLEGFGSEGRPRFATPPAKCAQLPMGCPPIDRSGASPYNCMLGTLSPSGL
jgi:hypothetical protein